jgi:hypothetical protein
MLQAGSFFDSLTLEAGRTRDAHGPVTSNQFDCQPLVTALCENVNGMKEVFYENQKETQEILNEIRLRQDELLTMTKVRMESESCHAIPPRPPKPNTGRKHNLKALKAHPMYLYFQVNLLSM